MTILSATEWSLPVWAVLAIVAFAAVLLVLMVITSVAQARARRRSRTDVGELETRIAELQARLDELSTPVAPRPSAAPGSREYVITSLGELSGAASPSQPDPRAVTLSAPAFADAILRESVVHTASFLHGVRRALAPETRNRIRFEMRRELKRTRKERKVEMKEALREYRARHRAEVPADAPSRLEDGAA